MHYKAPNNSIHRLDSAEFEHLLPAGSVQITDDEAEALRIAALPVVDPATAIAAKLVALRTTREAVLNRLSGIASRAQRRGDTATATACDAASDALLDITKDLPADLDGVVAAVVTRWATLVTVALTAAPALESAFGGVDL